MTVFWITLCSTFMIALLARFVAKPTLTGHLFVEPNKVLVFIVITVMVLVSGLRNGIGDTYFYMYSYRTTVFSLENILFKADFGFNLIQYVLQYISMDPQLLIFVVALVTNVLILLVLLKYSRFFELSIFLYITSGQYLVSMNGIRQFLAGALLFAATKYIFDGNWKKYMVIVLIASTIHQSALILIPIYFIVRQKAWTTQTYLLLTLAVLFVFGYGQFSQAFFSVIKDTKYSEYENLETHGANFLRVIVTAAPLIIAYFGREKLRRIFPKSDYIVNMCLINVVVMLISTQQWIFARFSIYFGLYILILIPWIIELFVPKDRKLVYYAILVCYCIYYYYESVISLNIRYTSNFFKL
ncbi:EpsG family protein [Paenibacillus sp. 1_12]|uniref:EpsG family protein n=1 Tax=Paenibacillus sp. 1_12 TaxID=1566278 RepID=UPI0008F28870|nr:EpsG family protein [Paenibacillus sp. 1_12]SFL16195.1 EpsG family protein [Paenibacillus sp. 1_12]